MKILLIGPQGSGKSTQGKLLSKQLNIPFISTGDIFREKALEDSEEGRRIKQILDSGKLVDDITTKQLVEERLQREDVQNGYILDGYPRTSQQADLFNNRDFKFDLAINFQLSYETAVTRLMSRGRSDDTPELIKTRIDLYKLKTDSLISSLKRFGVVKDVDAEGSVDEVWNRVKKVQNEIKKSI